MAFVGGRIHLPILRGVATRSMLVRPVSNSVVQLQMDGYIKRNKRIGRPLSPSLTLLAMNPNPVWILSFGHRASASIITPAVSLISIAYLFGGSNFQDFIKIFEGVAQNPTLWTSCKFMIALPFTYHCINGLRHLYWDTGRGFTMKFTYNAGYTIFVTAILSAVGLAFYTPSK